MQMDMIARVEGLRGMTLGSFGGCSRRSVTTWTTPIESVSTPLRQDMNSHDPAGRTQAPHRTEAASWALTPVALTFSPLAATRLAGL